MREKSLEPFAELLNDGGDGLCGRLHSLIDEDDDLAIPVTYVVHEVGSRPRASRRAEPLPASSKLSVKASCWNLEASPRTESLIRY